MLPRQSHLLLLLPLLTLASCGRQAAGSAPTSEAELSGPAPEAVMDAQDTLPDGAQLSAQSGTKLSDATARSRVYAAGISVSSSGGCSNRNVNTCTSLEQVNSGTIDGIITLKRASGCSITITGGTETGHAGGTYSHWNGYKLDISKNTCINTYITGNFPRAGTRGDAAPLYKSAAGNIYANEYWANHWDILYY
ncbi:hypothetical protein Dxin01_02717 [Deinococcus xinjiangensis]|uniref:Lipoprotein n=1 Tax=Deinococcus xinjiangensis TaxID=457454 RepID=A0ABP9VFF8_9DEIO